MSRSKHWTIDRRNLLMDCRIGFVQSQSSGDVSDVSENLSESIRFSAPRLTLELTATVGQGSVAGTPGIL